MVIPIRLHENRYWSNFMCGVVYAMAAELPWLGDPAQCKNRCVDASMELLKRLGVPQEEMHEHMRSEHEKDPQREHHWVCYRGWNVDFTARQFDVNELFPKVWAEPRGVETW